MVGFENFVKSLPPSLSELKVKPIFCFPIKIRDDPTASNIYLVQASKNDDEEPQCLICYIKAHIAGKPQITSI